MRNFTIPIEQINVFFNKFISEEIELLALDIEGIDAEIILDINFDNINLKYLSFEHLHLGDNKENVFNHLKKNNYEYLGLGLDHNGYDYLYINKRFTSI